ncbi:MAG: hypothetical protein ABR913_09130, partial [Sedimentisphaerales bacterium]
RQNPARFDPAAFKVIDRFRGTKTLEKFDVFAKAWQLRNVWKLDPVLMLELNRTYGPTDFNDPNKHFPLDWRHPDVHAIYWAVQGLRVAGKKDFVKMGRGVFPVDEINTDRIVAHSLQNLFRYGKIFIYDVNDNQPLPQGSQAAAAPRLTKDIFLRADFRMFDPYNKAITEIIYKYNKGDDKSDDSHMVGHRNMLTNALTMFYQAGHRQKAQKIYDYVRQLYPRPEFNEPAVESYIIQQIRKDLKTITITKAMDTIMPMLREAYFRYALRDDDASYAIEKMAEDIYNVYTKEYGDEARLRLPEFKVMRFNAILDFFNDQEYPLTMRQNLIARIKVEKPQLAEQFAQMEQQMLQESQQEQQRSQ